MFRDFDIKVFNGVKTVAEKKAILRADLDLLYLISDKLTEDIITALIRHSTKEELKANRELFLSFLSRDELNKIYLNETT